MTNLIELRMYIVMARDAVVMALIMVCMLLTHPAVAKILPANHPFSERLRQLTGHPQE
jgi:hypothetical protein